MLIKLILENYIPLLSSGIKRIELDTTEMINLFVSVNGSGKDLRLQEPIKIPNGWSTMGEMKIGTEVVARDGTTTKVTGVFPQGKKKVYRIHFADGRYSDCGLEHQWAVGVNDKEDVVLTTRQIIESLKKTPEDKLTIPSCESELNEDKDFTTSIENIGRASGSNLEGVNSEYLNGSTKQRRRLLHLLAKYSNKNIASEGIILKGLLPNDFVNTIKQLAWSLGGRCYSHDNKEPNDNILIVKLNAGGLAIKEVEYVGEDLTQCITVDHPERLFVTRDYLVTHNSSVLKELNPLPPENGNYDKGRKLVEIFDNNTTYVLDSLTGIGNGHSFKTITSDGEIKEHNPNGTFTVQKDLVASHFGLDSKLVKVLNGIKIADRLSVMSSSARKDLLMQVYPNDTDYALKVFNKLRIERNELKAAIKNQVTRYAEESKKLKDLDEVGLDELERRIKTMEFELKECLLLRGGLGDVKSNPELHYKINAFNTLTDQLTVNRLTEFFFTREELVLKIEQSRLLEQHHRDQSKEVTTIINENRSGLDGLEEFLKDPELFKEQAEQIEQDYIRVKDKIDQLDNFFATQPIFNQHNDRFKGLEEVARTLSEYLGRVTTSSTPELTGVIYKGVLDRFEQLGGEIRDFKHKESDILRKLSHYEKADVVDCPDCNSKFKIGVTKEEIERTRRMSVVIRERITKLEDEHNSLNRKIENDADWYLSMNQLHSFIRENSHIKILPELLKAFNIGKGLPNALQNALLHYVERFKLQAQVSVLEDERKVVKARLSIYDRNNLKDVAIYLKSLEEDLYTEISNIRKTEANTEKLRRQLKVITDHDSKLIELRLLKEEIFKGLEDDVGSKLRSILDGKISKVTVEKEMCLASIIKSRSLNSVVESISEDVDRLKKRLTAVEIIINAICPNRGLIGKMMTDFIEVICGNMNAVIKEIWETPLYIKPCNKEGGELTYKFPVVTGDSGPTPDVSDCSGGETDIIDWAFRFVLLTYVKFPFPLIMDEVAVYLDEIKRGRFFSFIKTYTERKDARQLFLVSHYFVQYAIFKDVNVIGFKYDNLTLPGEINQNSIIE